MCKKQSANGVYVYVLEREREGGGDLGGKMSFPVFVLASPFNT